VQQFTRKKNDLVLLRSNRLVASLADVYAIFQVRVMNSKITPFELTRLAMEEVHERQVARCHARVGVVAVEAKEVSVVAGGDAPPRLL